MKKENQKSDDRTGARRGRPGERLVVPHRTLPHVPLMQLDCGAAAGYMGCTKRGGMQQVPTTPRYLEPVKWGLKIAQMPVSGESGLFPPPERPTSGKWGSSWKIPTHRQDVIVSTLGLARARSPRFTQGRSFLMRIPGLSHLSPCGRMVASSLPPSRVREYVAPRKAPMRPATT